MRHRREIDGLRALAILPVILYHAGFPWISKGFLGVDVFFVISGFLITGILIRELEDTGRISVASFYERRARRILPALSVVMAVSTVLACFVLFPSQWTTYLKSLVSVVFFSSNFYFLGKVGYFDPDVELNPMLHTWSLAIEEQFYLLFPLVLWLMWKLFKSRYRLAVGVIAAAFFLSLLLANGVAISSPDNAFYLLQYRAWELLAGSLAALAIVRRNDVISNQWLSLVGLAMIVGSYFFLPDGFPHPGFVTLIPVLGTILVLMTAGGSTFASRLLSMKFFVGIGLVSYSAYLWHQPLFALLRIISPESPSPSAFIPVILLVFVLSALTWKFVESPFRKRTFLTRKKIFVSTAALMVVTLAVAWVGTRQTVQNLRISYAGLSFGQIEDRLARNFGLSEACDGFEPAAPECISGPNPKVLLWGDSYARQLALAMFNSPSHQPFIQQTLNRCAPILGLASQSDHNGAAFAKSCIEFNDKVFAWLKKHPEIKTVILGSPWTAASPKTLSAGRDLMPKTTGDLGLQLMEDTFVKIRSLGVNVVATFGTPISKVNGGDCIRALYSSGGDLRQCNWPLKMNERAAFNDSLTKLSNLVPFWSWEPILCPDGECLVTRGELFVYRDFGHLTKEASVFFGRQYDIMGQLLELATNG